MDIPQSGWKVLSVVGKEGDFTIIRDLLADAIPGGFELSRVSDTAGALEALERLSPDVLLVDSVLGDGESGLDCLRMVRERARHIPVILLGDGVETGGGQAAVDDYVDKRQMNAPLLGRVIRYAVERQQILARLDAANAVLETHAQERTHLLEESNIALSGANRALADANRALLANNELFESVFASIHLHIVYMDRDFNIIRVNRKYAEVAGRPVEFFPGKNHFDLYPNEEQAAIFRRAVATGEPYFVFAQPFFSSDAPDRGMTYWDWSLQPTKDATGQVTGLVLSLLNVTEQHRAHQALNFQGYLLDSVNDAVVSTDMNMRYTSWNRAAEKIFGWPQEEALGRLYAELTRPEYVDMTEAEVFQALDEQGWVECQAYQRCKDGRRILVEMKAALLRDETGRPTGIASVNRDITQRRQAEESLRLLNKRLEAQAGLSHKLGEANLEITRILDILAGWVADLIGDTCIVFRLVEDGQALVPVACHHRDGASDRVLQQVVRAYPQQISALLPKTIQESALIPVISIREFTERVDPVLRPYIDRFGPNSILLVPVSIHGRLIGSISMTRDVTNTPFTSEDLYFLEALAGMAALWISNADLYQAVQVELSERRRVEGELNEIQRRLIDGAESERLSLSRELHDGPIQDLYVIGMQLRQINKAGMAADVAETLLTLQESAQHMIDTLRAITMELRPPALTRFGLEPAIRSHVEQVRKMQPALEIQLDLDRESGHGNPALDLSERLRLTLYRIYQVAITNVIRHAQARRVSIRLRINPSDVLLEVEDDGRGFQMPERWVDLARQGHLGLVGGVERVEALGGTLQVISAPGEGTLLRAILPRGEGLLMDG